MKLPIFAPCCVVLIVSCLACNRQEAAATKALAIYTRASQEVLNFEKQALDIAEKDPVARKAHIDGLKDRFEEKINRFDAEIKRGKPLTAASGMALDLLSQKQDYEKRIGDYERLKDTLPPDQRFPPEFMRIKQQTVEGLGKALAEIDRAVPPAKERLSTPQ